MGFEAIGLRLQQMCEEASCAEGAGNEGPLR